MRIIKIKTLESFCEIHPDAEIALREWYVKVSKASWTKFDDIKRTFNSTDYVGNQRYVFNIKGNKYRIVAAIKFQIQILYIRFVGTHQEYDNIEAKNI